MKKTILHGLFITACLFNAKAQTPVTLLYGLQNPLGLWVKGDNVFFTEAGHNSIEGGIEALFRYRISSGQKLLMVDSLENSNAVVVASDGKIYLTSYQNSLPGNEGKVSVVDTTTLVETHLLDLDVASLDMCIDDSDNITISGYDQGVAAKSIYRLPVGDYLNPVVLKTGLGNVWCIAEQDDTIYYSNLIRTYYFQGNGPTRTLMNNEAWSMTFSADYLFYIDRDSASIKRMNLHTLLVQTLVPTNTNINIRYDAASDALYFLSEGSGVFDDRWNVLNVIHNATAPVFISSNTNFICGNDSTQLCAVEGYASYLWSNGDTTRCIDVKVAGTYNVTVTDNANHKDSSGYVTINAYPAPAPVSVYISGDTLTTSYSGIDYQWTFFQNGSNVSYLMSTSNSCIATYNSYSNDGYYYVAVMDSNGCTAISDHILFTDIKDLSEDVANVCPNPNSGRFNIEMKTQPGINTEATIYNVVGEKVYETTLTEPLSTVSLNVPDGIYFVQLVTEQGKASWKIVISR